MRSVPTTRSLCVLIMSAALFGHIMRAEGKSSSVFEDLVSGYLADEGKIELPGRTISYKAYLRDVPFPALYDAIATDSLSGISASTSREERFTHAPDAYRKAVANLLADLQQRGLMDSNRKPTPTPPQTKEPEPLPEQPQNKEPERDPTPEGDTVSEPVLSGPGPDEHRNEHPDLTFVFHVICTVVITAVLELLTYSPLKTVAVGLIGILLAGLAFYFTLGLSIFWSGLIAIAAFVSVEFLHTYFRKHGFPIKKVLNLLIKSGDHIQPIIKSAVCLVDVVPDLEGSYAAHRMKQAEPTEDMLDTASNYKLWSTCKGLAFILNNSDFQQYERKGSEMDKNNMVHLFQELGYKIVLHEDLTGEEITQNFKKFAAMFNQKGARYDSAVIVLMSHGNKGVILGTDLAEVKLRDLQLELQADKCLGLKKKPKLYFVQACRGRLTGIPLVAADGPSPSSDAQETTQRDQEELVQPDNVEENNSDLADVHFAFSTVDGYLSLRSEVHGSFFVQALSEVFFARAHLDNLDTLMNKVTDRVNSMKGKMYLNDSKQSIIVTQTPECVKRMRKSVYFLPKYSKNK